MNNFRSTPIKLSENIFINAEDGISNDVQILRVGTFFHEGVIVQVTKKDLRSMVKNFSEGIRGIDLMLDFSHESEKEAAAWFEDVYLSEDESELWAKVDWTEDGADSVRKKKYRYISADFNFAYKDNETLKDHGPTLLGAGLTNRPVIKKMNPTILSEHKQELTKEDKMNLEEMKKEMEELKNKNKELTEKLAEKDKNDKSKEFSEKEADLVKREEAIKLSEEKIEQDKKDVEKKTEFDTMLSENKAVEAQRESFMKNDMAEFIKNAVVAGTVNLSEKGSGKPGDNKSTNDFKDSETPAQDEVIMLAEKKAEDTKVEITEAISLVLSENKELSEKYLKETE